MLARSVESKSEFDEYIRRKVAHNALINIQQCIAGFEQDRQKDIRIAKTVIVILLLLLMGAVTASTGHSRDKFSSQWPIQISPAGNRVIHSSKQLTECSPCFVNDATCARVKQ